MPPPVEVRDLGPWTEYGGEAVKNFSGTARYTTTFAMPERNSSAGWLIDLGRVAESARVKLNGKELGTVIQPPYRVLIPAGVPRETNTLEVSVSNLMANRIADLDRRGVNWKKFYNINFPARSKENSGADNLFTAAHWSPRDSGLIGPVTLVPIEFFTPQR